VRIQRTLKLAVLSVVALACLAAAWYWWACPKRPVDTIFTRKAAFTFADIPRGRALSPAEIDGYARRLLTEMSLEEKVLHMSGDSLLVDYWPFLIDRPLPAWPAGADRRIGVPPIVASDGPHGVGVEPRSTCFPVSMARGASWDRSLEQRVAEAIGKEMRAHRANLWLAPCINLVRHPLGGRSQESYGEDPYLLGEMAAAAVTGAQRHNVMACVKHFALNSIERTRQKVDARADERTLREVYLPHFKRTVDAGVAAVMSAYNKVNGDYASENRHLLREILKGEWGFRGFVVSDWDTGVHDGVKAARAGLDLEMPRLRVFGQKLVAAVESGQAAAELIDEAVLRLLRARIDYATRPDALRYDARLVRAPEHVALAREAAEKSMVLLKNEGALPLDKNSIHSLAVLGTLADAEILGDHGSSRVRPPTYVTLLAGLRAALGAPERVAYEPGRDLARAKAIAKSADAVIVVAGFNYLDEGEYIPQASKADEGGDRNSLGLRAADQALIRAAASENPKTVVVLVGGSAITVEEWHAAAGAILMAFYPGERGGEALARVLFGEVNPSGKLPFTVPRDASQLPPFDNTSLTVDYGYYHGYTLVEKRGWAPRYPFGHGLSYTTFRYANLTLDAKEMKADGEIHASVDVTNTGKRPGEEVVQLYAGFTRSKVDRPVKLLRAFEKVALGPGETRRVTLTLAAKDLTYYDPETRKWVVERMEHEVLVGPSSRAADLLRADVGIVD
jgi:beta-glucosidase